MRAMAWVMQTYSVRLLDLETIIDGMEDDLFPTEVRSWEDVRAYCFKVASAVGLVLIEIYGYEDARARLHAIDMGIQLQLINILRDVQEDWDRGRVTSRSTCWNRMVCPRRISAIRIETDLR